MAKTAIGKITTEATSANAKHVKNFLNADLM